jgi:hypothetical protein
VHRSAFDLQVSLPHVLRDLSTVTADDLRAGQPTRTAAREDAEGSIGGRVPPVRTGKPLRVEAVSHLRHGAQQVQPRQRYAGVRITTWRNVDVRARKPRQGLLTDPHHDRAGPRRHHIVGLAPVVLDVLVPGGAVVLNDKRPVLPQRKDHVQPVTAVGRTDASRTRSEDMVEQDEQLAFQLRRRLIAG